MSILVHGKNLATQNSVGLNELKSCVYRGSQQKVAWNSFNGTEFLNYVQRYANKLVSEKELFMYLYIIEIQFRGYLQ